MKDNEETTINNVQPAIIESVIEQPVVNTVSKIKKIIPNIGTLFRYLLNL